MHKHTVDPCCNSQGSIRQSANEAERSTYAETGKDVESWAKSCCLIVLCTQQINLECSLLFQLQSSDVTYCNNAKQASASFCLLFLLVLGSTDWMPLFAAACPHDLAVSQVAQLQLQTITICTAPDWP